MKNAADMCAEKGKSALYIETSKGTKFFFHDPRFDIEEIAHATSMQCRYTGHCRRFYSVAEHSLLVSGIIVALDLNCDPFEGLMHDGTEAYLSDIAAPWKALLPDYKRIEADLDAKLRKHFHLPPTITEDCKRADWVALLVEAHYLLPSRALDWDSPPGVREQANHLIKQGIRISCMPPHVARDEFLAVFQELENRSAGP